MIPQDETSFLGRGVAFPPRIGAHGGVAFSSGAENVREAIRIILLTERRERIMLPEFGGGLKQFLFEPNVPSTHRQIEDVITLSLGRWEPRVAIESVEAREDPEDPRAAVATIRYKLVATGDSDRLQLRVVLAN